MRRGEMNTDRLTLGWNQSLMSKLSAQTRKRRKRAASKKRRAILKRRDD